jgi:hypothetical protein
MINSSYIISKKIEDKDKNGRILSTSVDSVIVVDHTRCAVVYWMFRSDVYCKKRIISLQTKYQWQILDCKIACPFEKPVTRINYHIRKRYRNYFNRFDSNSFRVNLCYRDEKNNLIYFCSMIGDIYQNKVLGQSSRALYVKYLFPPSKSSRTHSSLTFEVILSADPFPILFIYNECNSNNK